MGRCKNTLETSGKLEPTLQYHLHAALILNRDFAKGLNNLGCFKAHEQDYSAALGAVWEAAEKKPKNVIYWGNVYIMANKVEV